MTLADALQTHAPTALAAAAVATAVYSLLEPLLDNGPPGPYSWPLIGALPQASSYLSRSAVHEFFDKVVKDHGPIVRVKLGMIGTMYLVSDAELARRILTSPEFVRSDGVVKIAGEFFGSTLFALTGETWRIHRKMLQPAFGPLHLRHAISVAKEVAKELAEAWTAMIEASPDKEVVVDSHEYFKALTFDFIGKASFTHDFGAIQSVLRGESNQALDDYEKVSHILQSRFAVPQLFWRAAGIDPSSPAVIATRERIQGEIKAVVLERKKQMAANNGKPLRSGVEMDLLDRLLVSASDGTDVFNEDQISGEITGFFFAGHDSTANTLMLALYLLVHDTKAMSKLVDEIDRVYEELEGNVTTENMHRFRYLDGVLKETQRLYPSVVILPRDTVAPVEALGYKIPAGSRMMIQMRALHRNPAYWSHPDDFVPERWESQPVPGSYLPFGDGQHNCIGQKIAPIEMRFVLIDLLRQFRFELHTDQTIEFVTRLTFGLKDGLKVRVSRRER